MHDYQKYLDSIEKDRSKLVKKLIKWANINSHSYNFKGLEKMRKALLRDFSVLPATFEEVSLTKHESNSYAIRGICRPEAPIQIFLNGHMDTVYDRTHIFQKCTQLDEFLLEGPGVADMKGGLLIMLRALEAFEQCPWKENVGWQVFINPDEEVGSENSDKFFQEAAERYHLGLIYESSPIDGTLVRARRGSSNFTTKVHGKEAHAGRDFNKGRNAIVTLARFVDRIHQLNEKIPKATVNVGFIEGGGPINVVPALAKIKYNTRYSDKATEELLQKEFFKIYCDFCDIDGITLETKRNTFRPAKEVTPAIEYLFHAIQSCGKTLNLEIEWKDTGGAADGNNLAYHGLPNIDSLGAIGAHIHSSDELIQTESLWQRAQLSALLLMQLASGDIALPKNLFNKQHG